MSNGGVRTNRRAFLCGLSASFGSAAFAGPPETSLFPVPRPTGWHRQTLPSLEDLIRAAELPGKTTLALADARTGEIIEASSPLRSHPPASVTKVITALYSQDALGPGFRFETRLMTNGELSSGRLNGDIILVGGGDPTLDTDNLAELAAQLKDAGVREITGKLRVASDILPNLAMIDPSQPDHVGYNPSISGLNLNFNRVYFEWKRAEENRYNIVMDARTERYRPRVSVSQMQIADRDLPVYTYANSGEQDRWTVARAALGNAGGRWLPVRHPGTYAAEVFQTLARSHGIQLELGEPMHGVVAGRPVLAEHSSEPLREMLRGMLRFSTNLTAEAIGLSATRTRQLNNESLQNSGAAMADWMRNTFGARRPGFVDHSGLGDGSRLNAHDMIKVLTNTGAQTTIRDILKVIPLRDALGEIIENGATEVVAKTGTLNFVSSLAGYIRTPNGRHLAFAIFSSDLPHRARLTKAERERPEGGRAWTRRARRLQNDLLSRWGVAFDA